jgi:hypothetical protein
VSGRVRSRVRAFFRTEHCDAAVQCMLLPSASSMTVEGLRSELRAYGLRSSGLRADLERRWTGFAEEAEQR